MFKKQLLTTTIEHKDEEIGYIEITKIIIASTTDGIQYILVRDIDHNLFHTELLKDDIVAKGKPTNITLHKIINEHEANTRSIIPHIVSFVKNNNLQCRESIRSLKNQQDNDFVKLIDQTTGNLIEVTSVMSHLSNSGEYIMWNDLCSVNHRMQLIEFSEKDGYYLSSNFIGDYIDGKRDFHMLHNVNRITTIPIKSYMDLDIAYRDRM